MFYFVYAYWSFQQFQHYHIGQMTRFDDSQSDAYTVFNSLVPFTRNWQPIETLNSHSKKAGSHFLEYGTPLPPPPPPMIRNGILILKKEVGFGEVFVYSDWKLYEWLSRPVSQCMQILSIPADNVASLTFDAIIIATSNVCKLHFLF